MKIIISVLAICSYFVMSSCNIVAGATYILSPDPEQEALFLLPNVRTVVFVDDRRNVMHPTRLRKVIADRITMDLLTHEIVTTMISPKDIFRVSGANDRYNNPLPIAELGKAVEADVVIYVEMESFGLTNDGQTANPVASCGVRVVSVNENTRLFPVDKPSYFVNANLKNINPHRVSSNSEIRKLAEELAEELGGNVAKLFYDHIIGRLGENLDRK